MPGKSFDGTLRIAIAVHMPLKKSLDEKETPVWGPYPVSIATFENLTQSQSIQAIADFRQHNPTVEFVATWTGTVEVTL